MSDSDLRRDVPLAVKLALVTVVGLSDIAIGAVIYPALWDHAMNRSFVDAERVTAVCMGVLPIVGAMTTYCLVARRRSRLGALIRAGGAMLFLLLLLVLVIV